MQVRDDAQMNEIYAMSLSGWGRWGFRELVVNYRLHAVVQSFEFPHVDVSNLEFLVGIRPADMPLSCG